MYCEKCHYGSEVWKPFQENRCPQCSHNKITKEDPFKKIKPQSIRAMDKRKGSKKGAKPGQTLTSEIEKVTKSNVKARDYTSYQ